MIEIRYLQAESGANKFGTCNCCGKSSSEDPLMISIKFSYYGHGTLICLCDDCKKKLMEALLPANNSEIPNSSDTISKQAAIDALDEIESEVADGYGYQYAKWREYFAEIPSAQPEQKMGKWHRRFYPQIEMMVCSECQEEFSYDAETGIRDYNYCPNCGADMRGEQDG